MAGRAPGRRARAASTVAALDMPQRFTLAGELGNDQAGVLGARGVELHAVEQDQVRNFGPRLKQLGIGLIGVDRRMQRSAVIRRHHPRKTIAPGHHGVLDDGVVPVAPELWRRRNVRRRGIRRILRAEPAVDVVITGQPPAASRVWLRRIRGGQGCNGGRQSQQQNKDGSSRSHGRHLLRQRTSHADHPYPDNYKSTVQRQIMTP